MRTLALAAVDDMLRHVVGSLEVCTPDEIAFLEQGAHHSSHPLGTIQLHGVPLERHMVQTVGMLGNSHQFPVSRYCMLEWLQYKTEQFRKIAMHEIR